MFFGLSLAWPWNPGVIIFLLLLVVLYLLGLQRARKGSAQDESINWIHVTAFFLSMSLIALALLTPCTANNALCATTFV